MIQVFILMKMILRGLNKRSITWYDAERACRKLKADIIFTPLKNDGYFVPAHKTKSGRAEIYINKNLLLSEQLYALIHELTHLVCHVALNCTLFSRKYDKNNIHLKQEIYRREKHEFQADAIVAISQIPEKKIKHAQLGLFDPADSIPHEIWQMRSRLRARYGNFNKIKIPKGAKSK